MAVTGPTNVATWRGKEGVRAITEVTRTDSGLGQPQGFPQISSTPHVSPASSLLRGPHLPAFPPVGSWRQLQSAAPKTGPPRQWQWPGLRRAGSGWSQLAGLSSSTRCCSTRLDTAPGECHRAGQRATSQGHNNKDPHCIWTGASRIAIPRAPVPSPASTFLFMLSSTPGSHVPFLPGHMNLIRLPVSPLH